MGAGEVFENGYEVQELVIVRIREPTADGDSVLWVENIRRRRVIDDDGVLQVASNLREVLDVVSLMVIATLPEKPVVDDFVDVQLVEKRIAVLNFMSMPGSS